MSITEELGLTEPLSGKWEEMLDWLETRDRVAVQNFEDGRIKLVKPSQVPMMTTRTRYKDAHRDFEAEPVWRAVSSKEAKELWTLEVYRQYYLYIATWARHFYRKFKGVTKANGGAVEDIDLLDDSKSRDRAFAANRASARMNREANKAKAASEIGGTLIVEIHKNRSHAEYRPGKIDLHLKSIAKKYREQRTIEVMKKEESKLFQQEEMREKAKDQVRRKKSRKEQVSSGS